MADALLLLGMLQAVASLPADDPFKPMRSVVVEAIRDCGTSKDGEILVCSKDRGFSEVDRQRVKKLVKPKPVDSGGGIQIQITAGDGTVPPPAQP